MCSKDDVKYALERERVLFPVMNDLYFGNYFNRSQRSLRSNYAPHTLV